MEITTKINYYEILEVGPHSPHHEVTTAYERLRSTYSGENPAIYSIFTENEAREYLRLVEEAYSVLGNKTLRSLYDEKIGQGKTTPEVVSFEALQTESKTVFNEAPKKISSFKFNYSKDPVIEDFITHHKDWRGADLKKIRDYKKVTLDQMSQITKISAFYVNAIEEMNLGHLPAQVFVRGYVNQISKTLGLNDKVVCDSYMKNIKAQGEQAKSP